MVVCQICLAFTHSPLSGHTVSCWRVSLHRQSGWRTFVTLQDCSSHVLSLPAPQAGLLGTLQRLAQFGGECGPCRRRRRQGPHSPLTPGELPEAVRSLEENRQDVLDKSAPLRGLLDKSGGYTHR